MILVYNLAIFSTFKVRISLELLLNIPKKISYPHPSKICSQFSNII